MTQFGLCSWTLGLDDPVAIMQATQRFGLDGLQFHGDHRSHDPATVGEAATAAGLALFAIDPAGSAPRDGDPITPAAGIAYYQRVIDFAAAAGCDTVTTHGLGAWCRDPQHRARAIDALAAALQDLCDYAEPLGIRLLWEMCNRYEAPMVRTVVEGRYLHRRVARRNFALILDSFHMNIEDRDPPSEIRATGAAIAIYHVSDSGRGGIGTGHIDFRSQHRALRDVGFESPVMLEFVLPGLGPRSPPSTSEEWTLLREAFQHSLKAWRSFDAGAASAD